MTSRRTSNSIVKKPLVGSASGQIKNFSSGLSHVPLVQAEDSDGSHCPVALRPPLKRTSAKVDHFAHLRSPSRSRARPQQGVDTASGKFKFRVSDLLALLLLLVLLLFPRGRYFICSKHASLGHNTNSNFLRFSIFKMFHFKAFIMILTFV